MRTLAVAMVVVLGSIGEASGASARGVAVIARNADVREGARELARAAYADSSLRPAFDDATARVVLGEPAAAGGRGRDEEFARVARAAVDASDAVVGERLLGALCSELEVVAVVLVEGSTATPSARVFVAEERRFVSGVLVPRLAPEASAAGRDWGDAVTLLRGILQPRVDPVHAGAPSSGATAPRPIAPLGSGAGARPRPLLTSPWFWGGLAAVAAVGVTVLVLSQTIFESPDAVRVSGRIVP